MIYNELQNQGYDKVSLANIDDERLGKLAKAAFRLGEAHEEEWRNEHPYPVSLGIGANYDGSDDERQEKVDIWHQAMRRMLNSKVDLVHEVVGYGGGEPVGLYSSAFAVFNNTQEPKMYVQYYGHDDDPGADLITVPTLCGFDGFLYEEEGLRVGRLVIESFMGGERTSLRPSHFGSMPEGLFDPFLKH